ncbi:MAG: thiamine pyrophosphate-binding protein [Deltaproteobacteria bacterium]|nr:thiamine pyrophosphate-binding protein [Deltaproteobacteria bacterium]
MVKRSELIKIFASMVTDDMLVLTPIGATSNLWEQTGRGSTSLTSLSLGMCTPTALGLALALPHRKVIALDSDGNLILNLCGLGTVGNEKPRNLTIVVFDNGNYLSGGPGKGKPGMPTATAGNMDLEAVARGCGIIEATTVRSEADFKTAVEKALKGDGPSFIVAKVDQVDLRESKVFREDRGPGQDTRENKYSFVRHVERLENIRILKRGAS